MSQSDEDKRQEAIELFNACTPEQRKYFKRLMLAQIARKECRATPEDLAVIEQANLECLELIYYANKN